MSPAQVALTVGPLACYLYLVGIWQGGRHPKVVAGAVDFAALAFGVGGLITVGPVGQFLIGLIFGRPGPLAWALWVVFLVLWGLIFAKAARRRIVIYNLDPDRLGQVVPEALAGLPGPAYRATIGGFESVDGRRTLRIDGIRALQVGTIDARGVEPEALARMLRPRLREILDAVATGPGRVTWGLFGIAWMTMLAPTALFLATEPAARDALILLWHRIRDGFR